jgi:hypothetical protein
MFKVMIYSPGGFFSSFSNIIKTSIFRPCQKLSSPKSINMNFISQMVDSNELITHFFFSVKKKGNDNDARNYTYVLVLETTYYPNIKVL